PREHLEVASRLKRARGWSARRRNGETRSPCPGARALQLENPAEHDDGAQHPQHRLNVSAFVRVQAVNQQAYRTDVYPFHRVNSSDRLSSASIAFRESGLQAANPNSPRNRCSLAHLSDNREPDPRACGLSSPSFCSRSTIRDSASRKWSPNRCTRSRTS